MANRYKRCFWHGLIKEAVPDPKPGEIGIHISHTNLRCIHKCLPNESVCERHLNWVKAICEIRLGKSATAAEIASLATEIADYAAKVPETP